MAKGSSRNRKDTIRESRNTRKEGRKNTRSKNMTNIYTFLLLSFLSHVLTVGAKIITVGYGFKTYEKEIFKII